MEIMNEGIFGISGTSSTQGNTNTQKSSLSNNPVIMNVLRKFEGYKTKLKELHWAAPTYSYHTQADALLDAVSNAQDAIAEISQHIEGQVIPGTFYSIPCEMNDMNAIESAIRSDLTGLINVYGNNARYTGLINRVEDTYESIDRQSYLLDIAQRELYK